MRIFNINSYVFTICIFLVLSGCHDNLTQNTSDNPDSDAPYENDQSITDGDIDNLDAPDQAEIGELDLVDQDILENTEDDVDGISEIDKDVLELELDFDFDQDKDTENNTEKDSDILENDNETDNEFVEHDIIENDLDKETDSLTEVDLAEQELIENENLETVEGEVDWFPPLFSCGIDDRCPQDAPICEDGICVQCKTANDCHEAFACIDKHCRFGCFKDTDCCDADSRLAGLCETNPYCHIETGRCGECKTDTDCDGDNICMGGECYEEECFFSWCIDIKHYLKCVDGVNVSVETCSESAHCYGMYNPPCSIHLCIPFTYNCDGGTTLKQCSVDGQEWEFVRNCPERCNTEFGRCTLYPEL